MDAMFALIHVRYSVEYRKPWIYHRFVEKGGTLMITPNWVTLEIHCAIEKKNSFLINHSKQIEHTHAVVVYIKIIVRNHCHLVRATVSLTRLPLPSLPPC